METFSPRYLPYFIAAALLITGMWLLQSRLSQANPDGKRVTIGMISPLSGPKASLGQEAVNGALLALDEINAARQNGEPMLALEVEDSQGEPAKGVSAYRSLAGQGLKLIITQNSNVSLPVSQLVNHDRVLQLAISATTDKYSRPDDLTFRVNGTVKMEADCLAEFLLTELQRRPGRTAVVTQQDEYPESIRGNLLGRLRSMGTTPAADHRVLPDTLDFRPVIGLLKQEQIDYLILLLYQVQAGHFVKQLAEQGVRPRVIAGNTAIDHPEFFSVAGQAAENVVIARMQLDENFPAVKRFRAQFHVDPSFSGANAYDAVMLFDHALRSCRFAAEPECLKGALFSIKNYQGMSGENAFDDVYGDMQDRYRLMIVKRGKFTALNEH